MAIRIVNALLLIAAVIGGVLAYRAGKRHQEVLAEHRRLEKKVGDLPIDDPSKVYVRALETGEELHFAWRVYLPAVSGFMWRESTGNNSWWWNHDASEFIARVRFREDEHGRLNVFSKRTGGSSMGGLGNRQVADLLRGRWGEVEVQQLGSDGIAVVEPNEVSTLLRLTLPDDLKREAAQNLDEYFAKRFEAALFEIRFGSDKAFEQAATDKQPADE